MSLFDRALFGDSRSWVCRQAVGDVLEVAIGTGLNVAHYGADVRLRGIDFSLPMLEIARTRAAELPREIELREGDAQQLDFLDASFDSVVCTFSLCAIPDARRALCEIRRVLRPGGLLLLADHLASSWWVVRGGQRRLELVSVPLGGKHFLRRPHDIIQDLGMRVEQHQRFKLGLVERLAARKPN
jgi:ubiquinone/menaquinone biosynthesis C-methylase UbiE